MVGERLPDVTRDKPPLKKLTDRVSRRASRMRNRPTERLQEQSPSFENRNIGDGMSVAFLQAAVTQVLKDVVGVPLAAEADITSVQNHSKGKVYTIVVESPTESLAEARAFLDAGAGFTSILTDVIDVQDTKIVRNRIVRDTHEIEVLVIE